MVIPIANMISFFQTFWTLLPQPIRVTILLIFVIIFAVGLLNILRG